jgi:hypothetical protein
VRNMLDESAFNPGNWPCVIHGIPTFLVVLSVTVALRGNGDALVLCISGVGEVCASGWLSVVLALSVGSFLNGCV